MPDLPPSLIALDQDDYSAKYIGFAKDGRQFFLTTPFIPATEKFLPPGQDHSGREFLALYLFDPQGQFSEAIIHDLGVRDQNEHYPPGNSLPFERGNREQLRDQLLKEIGPVTFERIEVRPFEVERFGTVFGLVLREPEDEGDVWAVEAQPGNYMAFFEPWDSGDYDT